MDKIRLIIIIHILFTLLLLQVAQGVLFIYELELIPYGVALIIPCCISFYSFVKEFRENK